MSRLIPTVKVKKILYQKDICINFHAWYLETFADFWYGGIISDNKIYSSSSGYELLNHESSIGEITQNPTIDFTFLPKNPCIKMSKIDDPASGPRVTYKVIDCESETSSFICVKKPQDCSGFSKSGGGTYFNDQDFLDDFICIFCFIHNHLGIDKRSTQEVGSLDRVFVLEKKIKYEAEVQAFRQSFKETFKKIDLVKSFPSLFEILW